jgi:hypothetical protein
MVLMESNSHSIPLLGTGSRGDNGSSSKSPYDIQSNYLDQGLRAHYEVVFYERKSEKIVGDEIEDYDHLDEVGHSLLSSIRSKVAFNLRVEFICCLIINFVFMALLYLQFWGRHANEIRPETFYLAFALYGGYVGFISFLCVRIFMTMLTGYQISKLVKKANMLSKDKAITWTIRDRILSTNAKVYVAVPKGKDIRINDLSPEQDV